MRSFGVEFNELVPGFWIFKQRLTSTYFNPYDFGIICHKVLLIEFLKLNYLEIENDMFLFHNSNQIRLRLII